MGSVPPRRRSDYSGVFGFHNPKRLFGAASKARAEALDRASDLARRYGLPDPDALERGLHCLADERVTARAMEAMADTKALEAGRLEIQKAVGRLRARLGAAPLTVDRLDERLRHENGWNYDALRWALERLEEAAGRPFEGRSHPELAGRSRTSDQRRQWLVLSIASLYEIETGRAVCAYSDDGMQTGNPGAEFVVEVHDLLTGDGLPLSAVERLLRQTTTETVMGATVRRAKRRPAK